MNTKQLENIHLQYLLFTVFEMANKTINLLCFWHNWKPNKDEFNRGYQFGLDSIQDNGIAIADSLRARDMNELVKLKCKYTDFHLGYEKCLADNRGGIVMRDGIWSPLNSN